jgi:hypothetical protein
MTFSQFLLAIMFPAAGVLMGSIMYIWFQPKRPEGRR